MAGRQRSGERVSLSSLGLGSGYNARMIAVTGVMLAVIYVLTRSVQISIGPGGYVHMGDVGIYVASFLFGPIVALIAGAFGTSLADVTSSFGNWAPGTFVIHGAQAFVAGFMGWRGGLKRLIPAAVAGGAIVVVGYFLYMLLFIPTGLLDNDPGKSAFATALAAVWPNTFQVLFGAVVGIPVALAVRQAYPPILRWGGEAEWVEEQSSTSPPAF